MAKKLVKRKKIKLFGLFLVLSILGFFALIVFIILNAHIKNIVIKNTTYINDDYIIEKAGIMNYPRFWFTSTRSIEKKLNKSPYIKKVKVKKKFYNVIVIDVTENTPLFIYQGDNNIVFEDNKKINADEEIDIFRVPRLMNYVPDVKYKMLLKALKRVDKNILGKVSEMTYMPNEYDKDRFLLYMDDGNSVYLTLTKFKMLNYYNKVLTQLDGKKGILYLDSGNHFKIME